MIFSNDRFVTRRGPTARGERSSLGRAAIVALSLIGSLASPLGCEGLDGGDDQEGSCVPVDDDNPCTEDTCEGRHRVHTPLPDGLACDDKDACTQAATCQAGACVGAQSIACTSDLLCVAGDCVTCTGVLGRPGRLAEENPTFVTAGDLNRDGKLDLVVADSGSNTVSVLINQGHGVFAPAVDYGTGAEPVAVTVADLNGDLRPDLAVANSKSGDVSVLLNEGDGVFGSSATYAAGAGTSSIAAADLDGDTKLDLAVTNSESGSVSLYINHGKGAFAPKVDYALSLSPLEFPFGVYPVSIAAGDLNGDGKPDLAIGTVTESGDIWKGAVTVLFNEGNGAFSEISLPESGGGSVVMADLNDDRALDLVTASGHALLNQGDGSFFAASTYGGGDSVAVADFNGDGWLDLSYGPYDVFLNQGDGTFAPSLGNYGAPYISVTAGDLNGDGRPDLAGITARSHTVDVRLNQAGGVFETRSDTALGRDTRHEVVADLNGDNKLDIAVLSYSDGSVSVLLNKGDGTFAPKVDYGVGPFCIGIGAADVNGDDKPDLVVSCDSALWMLPNQGNGVFGARVEYAQGEFGDSLMTADLDKNGKLDLVVSSTLDGGEVKVLLTQDNGGHVDLTYNLGDSFAQLTIADLDGDGALDLVFSSIVSGVGALLNKGDGTFGPGVSYYSLKDFVDRLMVADMNGDGKLDILVVDSGEASVLLNQGGGAFDPPIPATTVRSADITVADMNGDGRADLISARYGDSGVGEQIEPNVVGVQIQSSDGTFGGAIYYSKVASDHSRITAADLDGDGRTDLAIVSKDVGDDGSENDALTVLLNVCVP